jgi:hypothetical protein
MKHLDYESFTREKREKYFAARALLGRKRGARRRERDSNERDALMIMDGKRLMRWIGEGTLEVVSPRHFILRLRPEDDCRWQPEIFQEL